MELSFQKNDFETVYNILKKKLSFSDSVRPLLDSFAKNVGTMESHRIFIPQDLTPFLAFSIANRFMELGFEEAKKLREIQYKTSEHMYMNILQQFFGYTPLTTNGRFVSNYFEKAKDFLVANHHWKQAGIVLLKYFVETEKILEEAQFKIHEEALIKILTIQQDILTSAIAALDIAMSESGHPALENYVIDISVKELPSGSTNDQMIKSSKENVRVGTFENFTFSEISRRTVELRLERLKGLILIGKAQGQSFLNKLKRDAANLDQEIVRGLIVFGFFDQAIKILHSNELNISTLLPPVVQKYLYYTNTGRHNPRSLETIKSVFCP